MCIRDRASKATGYPIAKVACKIAIGYRLDEILNAVTGKTYACNEPAVDYCVIKFPKWPFDKFVYADRRLGTQMKATGEVMSIGSGFEIALMKACLLYTSAPLYCLNRRAATQPGRRLPHEPAAAF